MAQILGRRHCAACRLAQGISWIGMAPSSALRASSAIRFAAAPLAI
jgi:hypothetical protein